MPVEIFGANYQFLDREQILTFEEIVRVTEAAVSTGVRKVRLTGGEPLLRRDLPKLVEMLAGIPGVEDLALTTNGALLANHAQSLKDAGLHRVTVSLDALDPEVFSRMNGVGAKIERVLEGVQKALAVGLPVKVNAVVQRGVNEDQILPLVRWARESGVTVRFIEFMDVGETNGWEMKDVVSRQEIVSEIEKEFPTEKEAPAYRGEVANRYRFVDRRGSLGVIASVTQPFCGDCTRLRLSAEGKIYTCLFSGAGSDLKAALREGADEARLIGLLGSRWTARQDRYSEERGKVVVEKAEMSYMGG